MKDRAVKIKLKLNNRQTILMAQDAGGFGRWVWNWGLGLWNEAALAGLKPKVAALKKLFTNHVKPKYEWMNKLSSRVDRYELQYLGKAFNQSGIDWGQTHAAIPECQTKKVTISREADGWELSFNQYFEPKVTDENRELVGKYLGIKNLAKLSSGIVLPNPKPDDRALKRLARLQRAVSRKEKTSHSRKKAINRLAKLHQIIANIRKDNRHKITTYIPKNHSVVVIADFQVAVSLKNSCMAQSIADVIPGEFRRQLDYKGECDRALLVIVNRFFPSNQLCSSCNHQQKMPLSVRQFDFPKCGLSRRMDGNASINLENAVG